MQTRFQRITPFLWFDDQAEEAAKYYVAIFDDARIVTTNRYSAESAKASGRKEGSVMTVAFDLAGQRFTALNGGPVFTFNESVSMVVNCTSQDEVDHYWNRLSDGGDPKAQMCGWLKDRFGLSWQVVPTALFELLSDPDPEKGRKAMEALMTMKKLDIDGLRRAANA
ncbi:putative 3-demethylubiquinone-9 3-methyltransferase (glyoxalase superfamily) [Luteibacter rhizovicinus]|uniref:Putative 3-demethylubiquinone-9 3-methyltransferase (Glyoxalase superfamily) n=1 Tax=Luteibacter rhizovicinus TaxID=242606 RepID=A0A4R3YJU7_9GAMM|nr:VOC family protein [Luteibacter rhizovicinus]TCV92737.1 putative 3-demethylubiquinone-9 3-methyltransferase (glyoxalase superfamily) [Luteibacter rhizovicinus]